ncbi:MAG: type II secretion system F family protein [Dermatophilaceae bacterium]
MSLVVALLAAGAVLLWPDRFGRCRLAILPGVPSAAALVPRSLVASAWERARRWRQGRGAVRVSPQDLLSLLDAISPALDSGVAPAAALRIAADSRSGSGRPDPLAALARNMASAAADGATLGPLWRAAAESVGSAELLLLAQAWSLTEDIGAPLAQAVRTTAGLLEARIAHERRLAAAVAGAKATVNLLTVLPIAGPLLALVLGIGPGDLFGGSRLTQGSLLLGLCLAGIGRWWVRWMVRAVARGPVIA